MVDVHNSSETSDFQSPAYDLYELNSVWTFKNIVNMLVGPRPADKKLTSDPPWPRARDLVRNALIGAYKTDRLVPINKDEVEEELRVNASGEFVPQFKVNIYEIAEYNRVDVIVWMLNERIMDTLHRQGHQTPKETIELIEKIIRVDQIKLPDSEADNPDRPMNSFEGIFPAPEGTRWKDVHFNLEEGGSLKIKVKSKERTLLLDDINRYFPQNQQRDLLIRVIRSPGGVLDNQNFIKLGENAFKNRKHIVYKLNKTLRELFGVDGNPIIFDKQNESYKALFCVYSDWKPSGMSD